MKKIAALIILFVIAFTYHTTGYCQNIMKVFYNGNTYYFYDAINSSNDELMTKADELSSILGFKYYLDDSSKNVTLEWEKERKTFSVRTYYVSIKNPGSNPSILNNTLYLPPEFIKDNFNIIVKYNKNNNCAYLLPTDETGNSYLNTFTNLSYDYSLTVPESVYLQAGNPDSSFNDNAMKFIDSNNSFSVTITCEKVDNDTYKKMRDYLNDYTSSNREIFNKIIDFKESYFRALKEYYKNDFLYGNNDDKLSESNIKVFNEYDEQIFGQQSHTAIYNVVKSDKLNSTEETYISIFIPAYSNSTLYSIDFNVSKGMLDAALLSRISSFINHIKISGLPEQESQLKVFSDKQSISAANEGIYPDLNKTKVTYSDLINSKSGYRLSYPSTFIQYRQNDVANSYDYDSYKIDYNSFFSVAVEPVNSISPIQDKISLIKQLYGDNITVTGQDTIAFGSNQFSYIKYNVISNDVVNYIADYFIINDNMLYDIQLNSRLIQPSQVIQAEFLKILSSFQFITISDSIAKKGQPITKYLNSEEGYTFSYPADWKLVDGNSPDINYDTLLLNIPDFSGPIDISVSEGELNSYLLHTEITKFLAASNSKDFDKYFLKYSAPYMDKISRTLMSDYYYGDGAVYLIKLVNYIDDGGRSKICYSKEIIRGKKIYSMFISVSDYATIDKNMFGNLFKPIFNRIISSFTVENTPDTYNRFLKGETRNRKVVFIEDYFKSKVDSTTHVETVSKLDAAGNYLVNLDGNSSNGFYWIKMNFNTKYIEIVSSLLKQNALQAAVEKLKQDYKDKYVKGLSPNQKDMTISLELAGNTLLQSVNRVYKVAPVVSGNKLSWNLSRTFDYNALKSNCISFIGSLLNAKVTAYIPSSNDLPDTAYSSHSDKQHYFIPVYTESGKKPGYFLLDIDLITDNIRIMSFIPLQDIYNSIKNNYFVQDDGFIIENEQVNPDNPFEIKVFMVSNQKDSFKIQTFKIGADQQTHELKINQ